MEFPWRNGDFRSVKKAGLRYYLRPEVVIPLGWLANSRDVLGKY
jgi:hypothetical protein